MMPHFLVPETTVKQPGASNELDLGDARGGMLIVTLGITRIVEQESLDVSVWGSPDGVNWTAKPILSFPQKFYCGVYQMMLDLSPHADVRYLQARWQVNRWGRGSKEPLFGIYLFVQETQREMMAMSA